MEVCVLKTQDIIGRRLLLSSLSKHIKTYSQCIHPLRTKGLKFGSDILRWCSQECKYINYSMTTFLELNQAWSLGRIFWILQKLNIHNHTYRKMRSVASLDGTNLRPGAWRTGLPNSLVCGAVRWPMALSGLSPVEWQIVLSQKHCAQIDPGRSPSYLLTANCCACWQRIGLYNTGIWKGP